MTDAPKVLATGRSGRRPSNDYCEIAVDAR